jgi:hypothetical protein
MTHRTVSLASAFAIALTPFASPAFAAGAMPAPSAAASAHCKEMASAGVDKLPASAWAPVAYPDADEAALRGKGKDQHAPKAPYIRVLRRDVEDGHLSSVVAEKNGGGWTLYVTKDAGGAVTSSKVSLNSDRTRNLNAILADACFWAEPTELGGASDTSTCVDAMEIHLEAVMGADRRSAAQHCSSQGLTGQAAEILWNQADVN